MLCDCQSSLGTFIVFIRSFLLVVTRLHVLLPVWAGTHQQERLLNSVWLSWLAKGSMKMNQKRDQQRPLIRR